MKPETRTVTQLFELDVRYLVPLYQRPYVWDADKQWEPLWEDIVTLLDHQENGGGQHYSHFLGAVVLEQETQSPGEIPVFTVIDGQQRLMTLQILLAAAANTAFQLGAQNDAEIIRDLVLNNPKKVAGIELLKVWPTNANRAAFQAVMGDSGPETDRKDDPENLIDEAYKFFIAKVREWACEVEGDDRIARLHLLRVTLCDLLKVVSITLEANDNAQVIFETLNARGTPLLALDLVKNSVFLEASRRGLDVDALYYKVWQPQLDDEYWREAIRQGRLFRPRAELFLMHWLAMKLRQIVPATELFTTFRKRILQASPAPDIAELIPELCRDGATMRSFDHQEPGGVEAAFFERLAALDTSTMMPLVLYLFREPAISPERRRRALRELESWLVRRMLIGLTTKHYNTSIPVILGHVAADSEHADEVVLSDLRTGIGQISKWPDDAELHRHLTSHDMYGYIAQPRIVMLFRAVEASLYSAKVEAIAVPTNLSIEHVMPQAWEEFWPLPRDVNGNQLEASEEARHSRINRLGNLTVTTMPLNASMRNSAWPTKQKALNAASKLLLNARLIDQHPSVFDESAIDERSAALADAICQIWPGPNAW